MLAPGLTTPGYLKGANMNSDTYFNVVDSLVQLRKKHHITAIEMAAFAGVSRQSIFNFERHFNTSYKLILSYITHPAFTKDELDPVYKILGG